jgi:hypothetical protein
MRRFGIREAENCKRTAMTGFFCYEFVTFMIDLALDAALNSCKKRSTTNYQAMKTLPIAPYLLLIIATSLATSSVSNAQNFGQQRQGATAIAAQNKLTPAQVQTTVQALAKAFGNNAKHCTPIKFKQTCIN